MIRNGLQKSSNYQDLFRRDARIWIRLANDQDMASQMPTPDGSQPAFQQQQQVQP
jgi:hypothetical protein